MKTHVMIVTDAWYPQINGVVRTLTHTRDGLMAKGYEVTMLTPEHFRTFPCPSYPEIRLSFMPASKVSEIIRTQSPDIIHIATEGPLGLAARNFCLRNNLNFTTAYHTRFPEYVHSRIRLPLSVTYAFIRWFHKDSTTVMVPTKKVFNDLTEWGIKKPDIWPRGVDLELFAPPAKRKANKKPVLLYVGRVSVEKNIEAFLSLDIDAEKWVVGDGPALSGLKKAYPDAIFHGAKTKEELPAYYGQADVFVFPSKTDTFGLVLLEAMACGLPVAAYPVTGPIDVVTDDKAGALDDDLHAAVTKALTLSRDDARAYAETYSWSRATDIFESFLVCRHDNEDYSVLNNPYKDNSGVTRAWKAFWNSWAGLRFAISEESAFRQELVLALILIPFALWLPASLTQTLLMVASVFLVLMMELFNSGIEAAIDRISYEKHGLSKRAKDYGSAAVLLALLLCAITYGTILYDIYMVAPS
ncbi:MAG: diacylglycerol kinase [Alphaproteobacteria bacterium]|nr:diacylglycerol kinase [Alphaproteobacteria bacterium]